MPEILALFKVNITLANPECDTLTALLREHSIQSTKWLCLIKAGRREEITKEMRESFRQRKELIRKAVIKCLADNFNELQDFRWDIDDFLTKEEQKSVSK